MMRSPRSFAVVCRRADGDLVIKEQPWRSLWERLRFLRWPLLRGGVVLVESLVNGLSALSFSAKIQMADEEKAALAEQEAERAAKAESGEAPTPGDATAEAAPGAPDDADAATEVAPPLSAAEELSQAEERAPSMVGPILISTVLALGLFVGLPHALTALLGFAGDTLEFHLIDGVIKVCILVAYMAGISLLPDIKRVFMYHGAEHKAIYAYEKNLDMTVDNARAMSRFHPRCGTSFLFIVIGISIVLFAVTLRFTVVDNRYLDHLIKIVIKIPLMFPVAGLAYEVLKLSARFQSSFVVKIMIAPGLWLQRITTREPTDDQLEVALLAIEKTLWRERSETVPADTDAEVEVYTSFQDARAVLQ